jgi:hypothetical protein
MLFRFRFHFRQKKSISISVPQIPFSFPYFRSVSIFPQKIKKNSAPLSFLG